MTKAKQSDWQFFVLTTAGIALFLWLNASRFSDFSLAPQAPTEQLLQEEFLDHLDFFASENAAFSAGLKKAREVYKNPSTEKIHSFVTNWEASSQDRKDTLSASKHRFEEMSTDLQNRALANYNAFRLLPLVAQAQLLSNKKAFSATSTGYKIEY